jgi:hydroxymethylbilane synthase
MNTLRLGTRGSLLARTQSQLVANAIEKANPSVNVELVIVKTTGDQVQDKPLADIGGKGLFTKELELALLRNEIDLAVHSYKDVPATMPLVDQAELIVACCPKRADARELLITRDPAIRSVRDLPQQARVATGSARRKCQLLDIRSDLSIEPIRGNIDSRIKRVLAGEFEATILAVAGVSRAGLLGSGDFAHALLPIDELTPPAGQGALALQTRRDDAPTLALLEPLKDQPTMRAVEIEREVVRLLNGDCHSPIGAHVQLENDRLIAHACLGTPGGGLPVRRAVVKAAYSDSSDSSAPAAQLVALLQN